jgi:hypothetical protein
MKWGDVLRIKAEFPVNLWPNAAQAYHRWVRASLAANKPYDQFARELLTSSGSNFRVGPVNFYRAIQNRTPEGIAAAVAAVALGATMIEKHLTLSRNVPGPDSAFSLEPGEFASMVQAVRAAEKSMGTVHYGPAPNEVKSLPFRRSLFAVSDIRAGEPFTRENVRSIRPSHGLPPKLLDEILGKRAAVDIEAGTPLSRDLVQP